MPFRRHILAVLLVFVACCGLTACWEPTPVTITSHGFDPKTVYEDFGVQFINQTDTQITLCVMNGLQCDLSWSDGNSDSGKLLILKPGQTSTVGFGCDTTTQVGFRDKHQVQITIVHGPCHHGEGG